MPLPESIYFDADTLPSHLMFEGISSVVSHLELVDSEPISPRERRAFCCIGSLDADELGIPPQRGVSSTGLAIHSRHGGITLAADYSRLTLSGVELPASVCLTFFWQFISTDAAPYNDFALFEALPSARSEPAYRVLLCDVKELAHFDRVATGWVAHTWHVASEFKGSLSWIAANGQEQTSPDDLSVQEEAFAFPPALLLESIVVHGPTHPVARERMACRQERGQGF